jgi:hypothetical protein
VNNYQRLQPLPEKRDVQFKLNLPGGEFIFPAKPVTIPADEFFIWPFNLNLGSVKLVYATAQLICKTQDDGKTFLDGPPQTYFFAETPGVKAEFIFDAKTLASTKSEFNDLKPGRSTAIKLETPNGREIRIVLLSEADSLLLHKDDAGHAVFDQEPMPSTVEVKTELIHSAGAAREIPLSTGKSHIAIAPTDADFTNAAVWKIKLPRNAGLRPGPDSTNMPGRRPALLRIHYLGDVARLTLNGKLIDDNFYAGREFDLGLQRYAPEIFTGDLRLEILPLRKDAPIYLEPKARPDFGTNQTILKLLSAELVEK